MHVITLLLLLFALSLIYLAITERFRNYASLMGIQGVLLFFISWTELGQVEIANLIFIIAETILFKSIVVPLLLFRIIRRTESNRVHRNALPGYYSILLISLFLVLSLMMAYFLKKESTERMYLTISLFALFTGLFLVVSHRKLFSHLIGFLVVENSVFLFSLSIGNEMPMMINTAILLDIFISVLILGAFMGKLGEKGKSLETGDLTLLKD